MLAISSTLEVNRLDNKMFTSANENLTQFIKVLLIKFSDMLDSSNYVSLFHRQSFVLYGNYLLKISVAVAHINIAVVKTDHSGPVGVEVEKLSVSGKHLCMHTSIVVLYFNFEFNQN